MSTSEIPSLLASFLERLQAGLESGEALALEFKKASGGLPKNLWETVSAFANTSGGWIILGIDESQQPMAIEGVPRAPDLLQTFYNQSRNRQKISTETCGAQDAAVEPLAGKEIIVIRIRAAPRKDRPVFINGNPYTGTFVRRHSGDYLCTKAEVDRMMREASDVVADSQVLEHFSWEDIDIRSFASYRQRFQNLDPAHDWNSFDDTDFLRALGGYRRERERGIEGITVASLLMFGRPEAIRDWRTNHLLDFRRLPGSLDTAANWLDRQPWQGNLLGAFDDFYPRLIADLPSPFRVEGAIRQDSQGSLAVREALVNLLVHADYSETSNSLIFGMPEGFLFRNPGSSRVPETELGLGHQSDPRNPSLVFMFRRINLAEQAGSGIRRIRDIWRDLGYRSPLIDVGTERYEFTLRLSRLHLISDEDRIWLQETDPALTQTEQMALLIARHDGTVDNVTLRGTTGEHPADTTKVLGSLRDRGLLEMIGGGRGAHYQINPRQFSLLRQGSVADSIDSKESSIGSAENSIGMVASSIGSAVTSIDSSAETQEVKQVTTRLIAAFRSRSRMPAAEAQHVVVVLCYPQSRSIRELAAILERNPLYISQTMVGPLVAAGRLLRTYPDTPNHPKQRYIATNAALAEVLAIGGATN